MHVVQNWMCCGVMEWSALAGTPCSSIISSNGAAHTFNGSLRPHDRTAVKKLKKKKQIYSPNHANFFAGTTPSVKSNLAVPPKTWSAICLYLFFIHWNYAVKLIWRLNSFFVGSDLIERKSESDEPEKIVCPFFCVRSFFPLLKWPCSD